MNVVLIDDDALAAGILFRSVEKLDFVSSAKLFVDSEMALEYIKENKCDVVISDICMPEPNGIELAKYCREHFPNIKFILISAYRNFEYAQSAINVGNVLNYFTKPLNLPEIIKLLKSLSSENSISNHTFAPLNYLDKRSEVFIDLLCGNITDKVTLSERISSVIPGLNPSDMKCTLINFYIKNLSEHVESGTSYTRMYNAIRSLAPFESETAYFILTRYIYNNMEWMIVSEKNDKTDIAKSFSDNLISDTKELFDINMTVTARTDYDSLADLINNRNPENDIAADERIQHAISYMSDHVGTNITLADVANHVYMTPSYLSVYFKKITGKKFIDILTDIRMKKTLELLAEGKYSINTICELVGYGNIGHFYKTFKKYYGKTPIEYQKNKDE